MANDMVDEEHQRPDDADLSGWPDRPVIYEVNTAIWLGDLSRAAGRRLTLADVPASDWDDVTPTGIDAVWLMGVWERSPAGLELANANAGLQSSFRDALPDLRSDDVIGSPYCVRRYVVDDSFGGPQALAAARAALAARGLRLLLDYVPNHVAPDHPWVTSHPELFVNGGEADIEAEPTSWVRAAGHILAHGRDPYFPPWPDVVQLDAFSPALRAATAATLADIAGQCDGIRCDMAMLLTNQVFARTWGGRTGPAPGRGVLAGRHRGPAEGRVGPGNGPGNGQRWTDLHGRAWTLTDLLDDRIFERSGDELADGGLFVALPPWGCHLLAIT